MTATTPSVGRQQRSAAVRRWVQRHGWTVGIWVLLFVLVVWYSTLIPRFGGFQAASIITGGTAWVFLGIAQAAVVIAGGLDLGVGGLLVLTSVAAAQLMDGQPLGVVVLIAIGIVIAAAILNGFVGWIISVSKVPDIVVTLGSLYVYQGLALMVLPKVGGGTHGSFRWIFTGSENGIGSNPWPAIVVIVIPVIIVAWWMGRTKSGLSLYAVGSDAPAAFLSGVRDARTKVVSFAVAGVFAALAGILIGEHLRRGQPDHRRREPDAQFRRGNRHRRCCIDGRYRVGHRGGACGLDPLLLQSDPERPRR